MIAARTGLLVFYACSFLYILFNIFFLKKVLHIALLLLLPLLSIISYYLFPSYYHRVGYTLYDYEFYKENKYREGSSDGIRYYSMISGKDIFVKNISKGVGFYNLRQETNNWFTSKFPEMKKDEMMLPHNQYLVYAASAGILGLLIIILFYIFPLFHLSKIDIEGKIIIIGLLLISLVDVFLDSQLKLYGLGYYCGLACYGLHIK
jgi:hypothetical protein